MIKILRLGAIFLLIGSPLHAREENSMQGTLAIGKMSGACGIMDSLIQFQKTTKMPGGDDFVARFWAVEATRLGMSVKEYSDQCDKTLVSYEKLWNSAETIKK